MTGSRPDGPREEGLATSRLRMWGYAAILAALAFSQSAGRMVADTKFDLVTDPAKFLGNALRLWDPSAAFGQVQNQAYGYAWPMGPFFLLGDLVQLPGWVVQRLWWTLLLCAAFFGIVRLAQRLGIGTPLTQVVAAFAFVLTPRITTLIGGTSVEVWPVALAPWVLLPLVRGSREGSVRRAAALSALVVACCGGVNAVAVAAVLPLGVIWILTRGPGPRRRPLLGWWTLFTALATLWWSLPLLVMGRHSAPFLDYIENATITSVPTGLARTVVGTSDWVAYFAGIDYPAGQELVTSPHLLLDAAAVAAFGLVGICLRGNPERRFLGLSVVAGVLLVGFGYSGDLAGFWAADRTALLDGVLAPLRNLHKFDVVLRIPLVLGLAYALAALPRLVQGRGARAAVTTVRVATVVALFALAMPWLQDQVAPRGGVEEVPGYWAETASYLEQTDDGTVSLVVPASAFAVHTWGNTHDDVMQGLAESPWAVRNVIPLAQPGNVVFLDAVTRYLESGHPSREFARFLASNGVGRLVVRNDLERFRTGAPDPSYVASLLERTPGLSPAESFGPTVGAPAVSRPGRGDARVIGNDGISSETGSVDVYDVAGAATATLTTGVKALVGDPSSTLTPAVAAATADQPLLSADAGPAQSTGQIETTGQILTDDMRRRETDFSAVRWNESDTMPAAEGYRLAGPEHEHRVVDDLDRWQTTEVWEGAVASVTASTSQADASSISPLQIGSHPGAALDGDAATSWRSARHLEPVGQFWQANLGTLSDLSQVDVRLAADSAPVEQLDLWAGGEHVLVPAPEPGGKRSYPTRLGSGRFLRITAAGDDLGLPASFSISEVAVRGAAAQRYLRLPQPGGGLPVDLVSLSRDPDRAPCTMIEDAYACNGGLAAPGEDGDALARQFRVGQTAPYAVTGTVSLRRTEPMPALAHTGLTATSDAGRPFDVAAGPTALVDGDPATTWIAVDPDEEVTIEFPARRELRRIRVELTRSAAASRPTALRVSAGGRARTVELDAAGRALLPRWSVSRLQMRVVGIEPSFTVAGQSFAEAPPGISSLTFGTRRDARLEERAARTTRLFACGSGPIVAIDRRTFLTRVVASTSELMRGAAVRLRICGSDRLVLSGDDLHRVVVLASELFRVDRIALHRDGAVRAATQPLRVVRGEHAMPVSVRVPERSSPGVLAMPQNDSVGWVATLAGEELTSTRVAGWKQAWVLPAGAAGEVRLSYPPQQTLDLALLAGVGGIASCLAVVLVPRVRRRRAGPDLPPLPAAPARPVDLALAVVVGGAVGGWWGIVAVSGALLLARLMRHRPSPWPLLSGLSVLVGSLGLAWEEIEERSWAVSWTQAWALLALAALVAALADDRAPESTR